MIKGSSKGMKSFKHVWTGILVAFLILVGLGIVHMFLSRREHFQDAGKRIVVNYYFLEKCPYCVAFNPEWEAFVQQAGNTVQANKIDGGSGNVPPYVKGFPYVEVVVGTEKPKEYTGARTASDLMAFVNDLK
jgi:thiol-disulfide isomerase/thioredoxin